MVNGTIPFIHNSWYLYFSGPPKTRVARRIQEDTGAAIPLPSYDQVRDYVQVLKQEPQARRLREPALGSGRTRQSPRSFALSIPAPTQLAQVDEHSMELYVVTPDGIPVTR